MKRIIYSIFGIIIIIMINSCATHVYSREIVYKKASGDLKIKETLVINEDNFKFVKQTVKGEAVFTGHFKDQKNRWVFEISSFKPVNAQERYFNPPIIYIYSVKKNPRGVYLSSPIVKGGRSPLQFIMRGAFSF
ncbi:MAG: hypothetical protein J7K04_10895 [Spirochaetales bacterium]|nr:hypothetical protein [Spirochaetales bacterium]